MIEFFARLFRRESSGSTAKERLRLVLLSDHLSLAPEMVEALKRDLIEVISRYVEVDAQACDVSFEQQERTVAMLANIPILSVPHRNGKSAGPARNGHVGPKLEAVPATGSSPAATAVMEPPAPAVEAPVAPPSSEAPALAPVEPAAPASDVTEAIEPAGPASHAMAAAPVRPPRRRRRRRPPGVSSTLPSPGT
jgi:cell division topological specificity factor